MARGRDHRSFAGLEHPRAPRNDGACFYISGDSSRPCTGTRVRTRKPQAACSDVIPSDIIQFMEYMVFYIHIRQLQPVRRGLVELVSETLGEVGRFKKGVLIGSE